MTGTDIFIAPQQLRSIHRALGPDFARSLEFITMRLIEMPRTQNGVSLREYAELREAKTLLSHLKYADESHAVRRDELAWAFRHLTQAYRANHLQNWANIFTEAAALLGFDVTQPHPMPEELERRIGEELLLLTRTHPELEDAPGA